MKSYVTLEQNICIVCGKAFDTGALLMDRRLRDRFEHKTITDWGMCPDDASKKAEGYIALIGCRNTKSGATLDPKTADRNGVIIHVRKEAFENIFDIPVPPQGIACIDEGGIAYLTKLQGEADDE